MKLKIIFLFLIATGVFSSCYYDKEDLLYGTGSCDTTNVKYSVHITAIINSGCISCHGGTAANGAGIKLGTYDEIKTYATSGVLLNAVTKPVNTMPKGGTRLSNCRIAEIRTWIRNGAPNN
jgi:mono/diheme cytochrome c family protein